MNEKGTRVTHYHNLAVDAMFVSRPRVWIEVLVLLHRDDHARTGGEVEKRNASPEAAWTEEVISK
jgi:hypothetical protein